MTESMNAAIRADGAGLAVGEKVELYSIDLALYGAGVYYFTPSLLDGANPVFDGQEYTAVPMEAEGFEYTAEGAPPRPRLRIANITRAFNGLLASYSSLVGAQVTRMRTLKKYLDGQPAANPEAHWPIELYRIERKSNQNKIFIEWELAAPFDVESFKIPRRRILRDYCLHNYRAYNSGTAHFNHLDESVSCPYQGDTYYDLTNTVTLDPAADRCAKTLKACRLRFGDYEPLPFWGFPGVARRVL